MPNAPDTTRIFSGQKFSKRWQPVGSRRRSAWKELPTPADVAAVKLRLGRPKDLQLCRQLIAGGLVAPAASRARLDAMTLMESDIVRVFARQREVSD